MTDQSVLLRNIFKSVYILLLYFMFRNYFKTIE